MNTWETIRGYVPPPSLVTFRGSPHIYFRGPLKQRMPLHPESEDHALSLLSHLRNAWRDARTTDIVDEQVRAILIKRLIFAKSRATIRRVPFALTIDHLTALYEQNKGCCELTGIPFAIKADAKPDRWKRPFSPSIDRIEPGIGYESGNVRLVCAAVNNAMGALGEGVLVQIAYSLLQHRRQNEYMGA